MGPIKKLLPIPFAGGIDTKTDPKQVAVGKLLDLQNAIFGQTGTVNRRWGYTALGRTVIGSANPIAACAAVNAFGQELLLYDGLLAYSFIPADNAWAPRGGIVSVIQTNRQVIRNANQQLSPDFGTLSGVEVYAWEDSRGGVRFSVVDATSGAIVLSDQPLWSAMPSTVVRPKVMAMPTLGQLWILFVNGDALQYIPISTSAPAQLPSAPTNLWNGFQPPPGGFPNGFFDATVDVSGNLFFSVWQQASGSSPNSAVTFRRTPAGVVTNFSTVTVPSIPTGQLGTTTDAQGNVWLTVAISTSSIQVSAFAPNGAALVSPTTVISQAFTTFQSVATVVVGSTATVFAEGIPLSGSNLIFTNTITTAGALGSPALSSPVFARSVGLASKPFQYAGRIYVNVAYQSPLQATYFTLDQNGNVVGKVSPGLGGGYVASSDFMLPECPAVAMGIFKYANLVKGIPNTEAGVVQSLLGVNATKLDFFDSNQFLSASINGALYTVGGILQMYDGAQYVEHGFHVYPETFTATPIPSGGALGTGTFIYIATYEWIDNTGSRQISTPSLSVSVNFASGSTNSVQLVLPTLRLTKKVNVQIVLYRTAANGTTLTRVTSALVPLYNNPAVDTVTFTDVLSDASIAGNGALYTQPLVQTGGNPISPNAAPPGCSLITTWDDRVFLAGLDDPYTLAYTKPAAQGIPMEFVATQLLRVDPDGGRITAIARMDDKFVIFKQAGIFYIAGTGPTATGDGSTYGSAVQIPSAGVGCANPNSVISTPIGLLFQSANGIYLLDRGLNVSYKGAPVEAFNSLPITSATLIPNQWVVFTSSSGKAIVYDYFYDQWSTFTNHSAIDSVLYLGGGNLFVWATPQGQIFQQTPTTFTDAGVPIPFLATLQVGGLEAIQGYQRVYHAMLLGTYKGTHALRVACSFDYDDALTAFTLIPSDSTLGIQTFGSTSPFGIDPTFGAAPGQTVYQYRLDILRKCQRIVFQITDQQSAPGNEGFSLSALTLVIGVKRGPFRVPATKQFGVS